jgi:hypothetical protein
MWSLTAREMKQERSTRSTRARAVPERCGALPIPKEARHTAARLPLRFDSLDFCFLVKKISRHAEFCGSAQRRRRRRDGA